LAFSLWYLFAVTVGWSAFAGLQSGWLAGFVFYSLVHHSHHHWQTKSGWMRHLKAYHRIHHQFPDKNYGVTMRFWDWVFKTQYRRMATPIMVIPLADLSRENHPQAGKPDTVTEESEVLV